MTKDWFEDRFFTLDQVTAFSRTLVDAGFKHVISTHLVDPEWAKAYRPGRDMGGPLWSIHLGETMVQMHELKRLIEICEAHDVVFWMTGHYSGESDQGSGVDFYLKIARKATR
jgi:hypothetical protein